MLFQPLKNELLHLRYIAYGEPISFYFFAKELSVRLPDEGEAITFATIANTLYKQCLAGQAPKEMALVPINKFNRHLLRICYTLRELGYKDFATEVTRLIGD